MNTIKKMISVFLLISLFIANFSYTFANNQNIYKQIILVKKDLKNEKQGEKYIKTIDDIVEKYKTNKTKLEKLKIKTGELVKKLENNHSIKYRKTKQIVNYLDLKVQVSILDIERAQLKEKLMEKFKSEDADKSTEQTPLLASIGSDENKKINDAIIDIQQKLLQKGTSYIQRLLNNQEEKDGYEETGDLKINAHIDHKDIGILDASFNLESYTQKVLNTDFQLQGKMKSSLETNIIEGENTKLSFHSLLDFISKDSDLYLLIENLEITDKQGIETIETYIEFIEEIASKNKYIKFANQKTQQGFSFTDSLNPQKIVSDGKQILSEPLFQAYRKENEKYYLIPTKYGCDHMKKTMGIFDPFSGKECSSKQYKDIIESIKEIGNMYITLGTEIRLGFEGVKDINIPEINWHIIFDKNKIKETVINISINNVGSTFEFDIKGANKKITGNTKLKGENEEVILSIEHNGKYDNNYFQLNNSFEGKNIYAEQISATRDVIRITNLQALMGAVEQVFQDTSEYPTKSNFTRLVSEYLYGDTMPPDPLGNVEINGCKFGYMYEVGDLNGVPNQVYKLSSCLESESNGRAKNDGGTDDKKYETGILKENVFKEKFYINNHTSWTKQDSDTSHMVNGNFNIETDTRENKNNLHIDLDGNIAGKKVFHFEVENISHRQNKNNLKVEKPDENNMIDSNEFVESFMISSVGGYAQDARNSKRVTDLNNILKIIEIKMSNGASFPSFIIQDEKYAHKEIYVAGEKVKIGEDYFVGIPNYKALGVKKEDFLDPFDGSEYIIGVTLKKNIEYEILARMEGGKKRNYYIIGTYGTREKEKIEIGAINVKRVTIKSDADINKLKKGDNTNLGTIISVTRDGKTLSFENTINSTHTFIELLENESKGLISIDGKIVENNQIIE